LKNLRFSIQSDNPNLNDFLIISDDLGGIPNRTLIHDTFDGPQFEEIIEKMGYEDKTSFSEIIPLDNDYCINEKILFKVNLNLWCSYTKLDKESENFTISDVCIYFKNSEIVEDLLEKIKKCSVRFEDDIHLNKMNILSVSNGSLELDPIFIDENLDIENQSKKNIKKAKKILKSIKSKNKTISIIRGPRGTGKTNISKWISSKSDIISVFIPNNMIDHTINNPEFRNFLKRFDRCILILDDCEFNYGYGKMPYLSGNILQLLDMTPNIHIIMVFNIDEEYEIDENLLGYINLEDEVYFELLDPDFASDISKRIGYDQKYSNRVSISDVFNGQKDYKIKKIGIQ
jgi:hypothetical protein